MSSFLHVQAVRKQHHGQGHIGCIRLPSRNLRRDRQPYLDGIIARLNGQEHRLKMEVFSYGFARGGVGQLGSRNIPRVHGADQKGTSLITNGWGTRPAGVTNLFLPGDLIEIQLQIPYLLQVQLGGTSSGLYHATGNPVDGRLHRIVDTVSWAAQVTLPIWPPITIAPDNDARIISNRPRETWILVENDGASSSYTLEVTRTLTFVSDLLVGREDA